MIKTSYELAASQCPFFKNHIRNKQKQKKHWLKAYFINSYEVLQSEAIKREIIPTANWARMKFKMEDKNLNNEINGRK